jgi:hypothetical protein
MKPIKTFAIILLLNLIFSCSAEDDNGNDNNITVNFRSQICNTVTGATALHWDHVNGILIPLNQIPLLDSFREQFIHSQYPALGFQIPNNYKGIEVFDSQRTTLGVNIIRDDNAVVWRYIASSSFQGAISVTDIMAFEINQMFGFYQFNGNFEVLCTNTRTSNQNGIATTFSARLIRFGNFTGTVWVNTQFVQSIGTTFVSSSVASGPTNEYDNLVSDFFLPFSFQLIAGGSSSELDSDLDGFPDNEDNFPFDPTRH